MLKTVPLAILGLLLAVALVVPAHAFVLASGEDCVIFGKTTVKMENGPTNIQGEVCVNDPGGFLRVGVGNTIESIIADRVDFGGGTIADCKFNTVVAGNPNTACTTQGPTPPLPLVAWPPLPVPVVNPCLPNVTVAPGGTQSLAPGCANDVRLRDAATLNLSAGTYDFKSLRMETGSTLNCNGATVNMTGGLVTEPAVTINDCNITSIATGTFEAINIGNSSKVNNSVLFAPNARMHLHLGGTFANSEFIAVFVTVEPITITTVGQAICACVGTANENLPAGTIELRQGCHLNAQGLTFFLSPGPNCPTNPIACPGCTVATRNAGATDTSADLAIPAGAHGTFRVVVQSAAGSYCTADTVTIP